MPKFRILVPSIHRMEVFEFQDGDPTYQRTNSDGTTFPGGISVAKLQQQIGAKEGEFTGPSGETYFISLAAWDGQDPEKTLLHMVFHSTPLLPADVAPELRSFPVASAPPSQQPSQFSPPPVAANPEVSMPSSSHGRPGSRHANNFISCSDVHREHRVKIQQSKTLDTGVAADVLLTLPEITTTDVHCPVCSTKITFSEPLDKRLQQAIEWWGSEATIQLIFEHPVDVEETQTIPGGSPFVVHRYRHYTPISVPARPKEPDVELSIVLKTHDHLITLISERGETTAKMLLALPEAQETELVCPFCEEKLPVPEPFEQYVRILADDANGESTPIEWSISHPHEIAPTKIPTPGSLIRALQHSNTDKFAQKQYEGYPGFVVRKRSDIA